MLALSQAIVGEATWRAADRAPLAWVLAKRWHQAHKRHPWITFERMVRSYASPMKKDAHWVRKLPWGPVAGPYSERWADVRRFVREWADGKHPDPCPEAMHWGAGYGIDLRRATDAGWHRVDCGATANVFWRLGR